MKRQYICCAARWSCGYFSSFRRTAHNLMCQTRSKFQDVPSFPAFQLFHVFQVSPPLVPSVPAVSPECPSGVPGPCGTCNPLFPLALWAMRGHFSSILRKRAPHCATAAEKERFQRSGHECPNGILPRPCANATILYLRDRSKITLYKSVG